MDKYIINEKTMYIKALREGRSICSEIGEYGCAPFFYKKKPLHVIEDSLFFYHSTYKARKTSTKLIADIHSKPPILIQPGTQTYFFPTHSNRSNDQAWINVHFINRFHAGHHYDTVVEFDDQSNVSFPITPYTFNTQYLHGIKLEYSVRAKALKQEMYRQEAVQFDKCRANLFEMLAMYALLERKV
ncbi:competence protein ComK [Macrococcoides caseolyticum]|uniref:competence protein ComK n=1 Tax=Macrococcoides caseolyticum TaxID=69966 RepID=UPI001F47B3C9|nr:competence protein ComK [Macrococcus caseolyticus]MCE4957679.1 competence protein ComK [Macrococcus caseolyticus]